MGGPGSGTWYRWDRKSTLEEYRRVDIRPIYKNELLYPGSSFSWRWRGSDGKPNGGIRVEIKEGRLLLIYRIRKRGEDWEDVRETVHLSRSDCALGGSRPWFICPGVKDGRNCGRRVAILYGVDKYFLCRHCYGLSNASRNETDLDRAYRKRDKLRARLGGKSCLKPKRMHQKTFEKLRHKLTEAEMRADELLCQGVAKMMTRLPFSRERYAK